MKTGTDIHCPQRLSFKDSGDPLPSYLTVRSSQKSLILYVCITMFHIFIYTTLNVHSACDPHSTARMQKLQNVLRCMLSSSVDKLYYRTKLHFFVYFLYIYMVLHRIKLLVIEPSDFLFGVTISPKYSIYTKEKA